MTAPERFAVAPMHQESNFFEHQYAWPTLDDNGICVAEDFGYILRPISFRFVIRRKVTVTIYNNPVPLYIYSGIKT